MAADPDTNKTLEERLRTIVDRFEIYNLIASHPPSADTGAADYTASAWAEGGVFDRGAEFPQPTGRAAIAGGSTSPEHRRAIGEGIAHFAGLPYVRITGDTAFAISYLQILDPRPRRSALRYSQSRLLARFPRASRFSQSLGVCSHRGGLEDQAANFAFARRYSAGSRHFGRRAGVLSRWWPALRGVR
jgi:hypothetical protein